MSTKKADLEAGIPMAHYNTSVQKRAWQESGQARLCMQSLYVQEQGCFHPLESRVHGHQKSLK